MRRHNRVVAFARFHILAGNRKNEGFSLFYSFFADKTVGIFARFNSPRAGNYRGRRRGMLMCVCVCLKGKKPHFAYYARPVHKL